MDKTDIGLLAAILIGVIMVLLFAVFPRKAALDIAAETGCEYIGIARDVPSVGFFDCNGEVKLKRLK